MGDVHVQRHRAIRDEYQVDWLLSRVLKEGGITVDPILRGKLNNMREYRNDLAHFENPASVVPFFDALSNLNRLAARL